MSMSRLDVKRYAPPGFNVNAEVQVFIIGLAASFIFSFTFIPGYVSSRNLLYDTFSAGKVLIEGSIMPDFADVLGYALYGFFILSICMLSIIVFHYIYHYKDSKSIYLMKRLPKPSELHKRCLILPVTMFFICMISAFIMLTIYFGICMIFTPEQCIVPGQWQRIWRA